MQQRIDLISLVNAALGAPTTGLYLDRLSGQVLLPAEVKARCGVTVAVQERYVRVPTIHSRLRLDDARDFATSITPDPLRARVETLLYGPRAPWAFERELSRQPALDHAWRSWERACATARVLGWLGRINVPFSYPED